MVTKCEICGVRTAVDSDSNHYYCEECEQDVNDYFEWLNDNTPSFQELVEEHGYEGEDLSSLEAHSPLW